MIEPGRGWMAIGAASAGLAVAAGAFGAHALKTRLAPEMLGVFETGARYQMYHALALLLVGVIAFLRSGPRAGPEAGGTPAVSVPLLRTAGWAFTAGTLLFSGSLYALALTGVKAWGAVTPLGGLSFLAGWTLLAAGVLRRPAPSP